MNIRQLTGRFAVADGAPNADQIAEFKSKGFNSVISLRNAGENDEVLAPDAEGKAVEAAGMTWLHYPMEGPEVGNVEITDGLSRRLQELPAPVLVHCASGGRAGGVMLAICAVGENWDLETADRKAADAGINVPPVFAPRVAAYVKAKQG